MDQGASGTDLRGVALTLSAETLPNAFSGSTLTQNAPEIVAVCFPWMLPGVHFFFAQSLIIPIGTDPSAFSMVYLGLRNTLALTDSTLTCTFFPKSLVDRAFLVQANGWVWTPIGSELSSLSLLCVLLH